MQNVGTRVCLNRVTRAADGSLIQMYISHTVRVQESPLVDAYNT